MSPKIQWMVDMIKLKTISALLTFCLVPFFAGCVTDWFGESPSPGTTHIPKDSVVADTSLLDFELKLLGRNTIPFKELKSKNVFIFFSNASCSHCRAARPSAQAFADSIKSDSIQAILIFHALNTLPVIEGFFQDSLIRFPAYHDTSGKWFSEYGESGTPMFMAYRAADSKWLRQTGYTADWFDAMKEYFLAHWSGSAN